MAYSTFMWRKENPEKRKEQRKQEKIRRKLRDLGYLPSYGEDLTDKQKIIYEQISNNDYSFWDIVKTKKKLHDGGKQHNLKKEKSPEQLILERTKQNSKKRNKEFNIEIDDIVIPKYCPYLDVEISTNYDDRFEKNYYSIDRINSDLGYIKGNVQIVSRMANTMKNNATNEELITFAKNILKNNGIL